MTPMIPKHILKYPTPLHIFYRNRLEEDAQTLAKALSKYLPHVQLYYSTKTNALLSILKTMLSMRYGLEVMAPGDLKSALLAGARGDQLLLNGPAFTKELLESAIFQYKVKHIHIDSKNMLELLGAVLKENSTTKHQSKFGIRIHAGNSHLGFPPDAENIRAIATSAKELQINFESLHIHSNTNGNDAFFTKNLQTLIAVKKNLLSAGFHAPSIFDLGGGFESPSIYRLYGDDYTHYHSAQGIPASAQLAQPSLSERVEKISLALSSVLKKEDAMDTKIYFEPGRAIVTRALSTLLSVRAVKTDLYPDAQILITNGSTALLGPIHRAIHPMHLLQEQETNERKKTFVYGQLPHEADWLIQAKEFPLAQPEDHFLIEHTGAYFLPLESNFGHPRPGIYDAENDSMIRDPENAIDLSVRDRL